MGSPMVKMDIPSFALGTREEMSQEAGIQAGLGFVVLDRASHHECHDKGTFPLQTLALSFGHCKSS